MYDKQHSAFTEQITANRPTVQPYDDSYTVFTVCMPLSVYLMRVIDMLHTKRPLTYLLLLVKWPVSNYL